MAGQYSAIRLHLVWGVHSREHLLHGGVVERLHAYIGGVVEKSGGRLLCAGGMPDHVHLLVSIHPSVSVSALVNKIKSNSSRWMRSEVPGFGGFRWQAGYGVFSVSESARTRVERYIRSQEEHHRQRSFREEFVALLDRHGIAYEPKYLWTEEEEDS